MIASAIIFEDAYSVVRRRSLPSEDKLRAIWSLAEAVADVPGDAAELGVYRGGTGHLIATACPDRAVRLFDTFTGIPWDGFNPADDGHRPGEFAASYDDVRAFLADRPNVTLHPGLFPGSAADLAEHRFALVHLDADLYASTLAGLRWFWPRLNPGGVIVLDDWQWPKCPGVMRAVAEFFAGVPHDRSEPTPHQLAAVKPK